ncbi:MAG: nickel-dependent lactate racemase [Acidobacteriota bacterium]|jgi:nickel-dependent lactate racemase|nr:nickel-dependent lactate racemase [Acidobacteriota bacterium]NLT33888.1 nickel-dependent lactate racemase [Acidobacteriota bacterium]
MILRLPYGKEGHLEAAIDEARIAGIIEPNRVPIGDEEEVIRRALEHPFGSPRLGEFLAGARDVLVIVNDQTRPTPTARVLDFLEPELAGRDVSFIVATGAHRAPTPEEYVQIFSERHYARCRDRIFVHDARRSEEMVYLGTSKNGTEMRVNRRGVEADRIVIISSVEPHYFAGYTGGRKSFLPGIAAFDTIEQNHKLALRREASALRLEGNPVHEDMIDALSTVKKEIFAINTVLDRDHRIYAAAAGDIYRSLEPAVARANEVFVAEIPRKADIVISVVKFPSDIDLYQAQKGIDNAKYALKEGGILLLVAKCRMGIGDESFARLLGSAGSPADALRRIEEGFVLGYHKAAKMAEIGLWAQVWGVTDLDPAFMESVFIRPFAELQGAVDAALAEKGPDASVLVLMDGSLTIPVVRDQARR